MKNKEEPSLGSPRGKSDHRFTIPTGTNRGGAERETSLGSIAGFSEEGNVSVSPTSNLLNRRDNGKRLCVLVEPPYADAHVRWCGRRTGFPVRLPDYPTSQMPK